MSDAVVVASGHTVIADLIAIRAVAVAPVTFAVNDMIPLFDGTLAHAVSHHGDKLPAWLRLRTREDGRTPREPIVRTHSSKPWPDVKLDHVWRDFTGGGSSSLLAVRIALHLGHERVFVAGVPLDAGGHLWSLPSTDRPKTMDYARFRGAWRDHVARFRGHVFAPSGFLAELLGPLPERTPTHEVA